MCPHEKSFRAIGDGKTLRFRWCEYAWPTGGRSVAAGATGVYKSRFIASGLEPLNTRSSAAGNQQPFSREIKLRHVDHQSFTIHTGKYGTIQTWVINKTTKKAKEKQRRKAVIDWTLNIAGEIFGRSNDRETSRIINLRTAQPCTGSQETSDCYSECAFQEMNNSSSSPDLTSSGYFLFTIQIIEELFLSNRNIQSDISSWLEPGKTRCQLLAVRNIITGTSASEIVAEWKIIKC